jgi:tetratricopeptide (TPR) repeat protein
MERIHKIEAFLAQNPKDNFLRHALALEWIKLGDDEKARALFEGILTDSPDYVGSYYHLGKLLERKGIFDLAVEWYEKGILAAKSAKDQHSYNELQAAKDEIR